MGSLRIMRPAIMNAMTTTNQLILTYWLVRPESDLHTPDQMRAAGEAGVYEPVFTSGERRMLCMVSRFDKADPNARITAAMYAIRNAKQAAEVECPGANVWGSEVWLDGDKLSPNEIPE